MTGRGSSFPAGSASGHRCLGGERVGQPAQRDEQVGADRGEARQGGRQPQDAGEQRHPVPEPVRGFGAAAHAGLRAATTDLVCFCDCDGSLDARQLPRLTAPLLADGNIVIGGSPTGLLRRCAQLLAPGGRILIEAEPGDVDERITAWLEHPDGRRGPPFPRARVGAAAVTAAAHAGLHVTGRQHADRVFVCAATPIAGARVTTPSSATRGELWCPPECLDRAPIISRRHLRPLLNEYSDIATR
jgi:hypothetical protein